MAAMGDDITLVGFLRLSIDDECRSRLYMTLACLVENRDRSEACRARNGRFEWELPAENARKLLVERVRHRLPAETWEGINRGVARMADALRDRKAPHVCLDCQNARRESAAGQ